MKKKMMLIGLLSSLLIPSLVILGLAADLDVFKGESGTLKISGGTAHIPVMKLAAQKIMTASPAIRISIAGGGSGAAQAPMSSPSFPAPSDGEPGATQRPCRATGEDFVLLSARILFS